MPENVGTGEENLIPWVISCYTTIFSLQSFLNLMCFLYWVIQSGPLFHMCLSSLSLNLQKNHFALTASTGRKCPKPTITTFPGFVLHQVPVSCICRLLLPVLEEAIVPSSLSFCHRDFIHPDYFLLLLFYLFRGMIFPCLFFQPKLREISPDLIFHDNLFWTSLHTRGSRDTIIHYFNIFPCALMM